MEFILVGIASDHRGVQLKKVLVDHFKDFKDYGTMNEESTDYPIYAFKIGEEIRDKKIDFGILICGSGIGMSIACNKVKGVRCAKVDTMQEAEYTRNDNDANVIAISAGLSNEDAIGIVETFLNTPFSNLEKHQRRIDLITKYEENNA